MPRRFAKVDPSQEGIQIRLNDSLYPANLCETKQRFRVDRTFLPVSLQRLQHGIETNSMAILEAISDGLFTTVYLERDAIDLVGVDAFLIGVAAEPEMSNRRILEPWRLGSARDGDIDFMRNLSRQFVPSQGGNQTEHASRNLERKGDQIRMSQ